MKNITTILLLLTTSFCFAQEISKQQKPDYEAIQELTSKSDENNYQKLYNRLIANDSTLSIDQYYVLYYGQPNQSTYNPYSMDNKAVLDLLAKNKLDEFLVQAREHLTKSPFDMQVLEYFVNVNFHKDNIETANLYLKHMTGFVGSILNSGDGKSLGTAIHVMAIPDEYVILRALKLNSSSRSTKHPCDVFQIAENPHGIKELYFNMSKPFEQLNKLMSK